jgi:hypothetical protein
VKAARELGLGGLQRWMQHLILHADGLEAAAREAPGNRMKVADVVLPSATLAAEERLGIYADMVRLRFDEVLTEDYPALAATLGLERWQALLAAYLARHPSSHFSLNRLGARLPDFLASWDGLGTDASFPVELARLELAVQQVFDEREVDVMTAEDLLAVPEDAWPELRLATIPALRLFAFAYPTNAYLQAWREDQNPRVPDPSASWVVVYRHDDRVWRAPLDPVRHALLVALQRGEPLGRALGSCCAASGAAPAELAPKVGGWFREWAADGLFRAPRPPRTAAAPRGARP